MGKGANVEARGRILFAGHGDEHTTMGQYYMVHEPVFSSTFLRVSNLMLVVFRLKTVSALDA
jgi:hypothetical protein